MASSFAAVLLLLVMWCAAAQQQKTLINVTLPGQPQGPPDYFVGVVPGIAAMQWFTTQLPGQQVQGTLSVVSNTSGKVLWTDNTTWWGSGSGLGYYPAATTFSYFNALGSFVVVNAANGQVKYSVLAPNAAQVFAFDDVGLVAVVANANGGVALVDCEKGVTRWMATVNMPEWNPEFSTLAASLSEQYVAVVNSGILFMFAAADGTILYQLNITEIYGGTLSGRYAIVEDTMVFCGSSNVSYLTISTGKVTTIAALNTEDYNYEEVIQVAGEANVIYLLTVDGSFRSSADAAATANSRRRRRNEAARRRHHGGGRVGNNYPMIVSKNNLLTGTQIWQYFTDSTLGYFDVPRVTQTTTPLLAMVGPIALDRRNGNVVAGVNAGIDYMEQAPPLIYNAVWYFGTMEVTQGGMSDAVAFLAIEDDHLL